MLQIFVTIRLMFNTCVGCFMVQIFVTIRLTRTLNDTSHLIPLVHPTCDETNCHKFFDTSTAMSASL
jgi:hypothetical protein